MKQNKKSHHFYKRWLTGLGGVCVCEGYLDAGDYMDYYINVDQAGTYAVAYRTAAESEMGAGDLQLIDSSGNATLLHSVSFPSTGGWQNWTTTSKSAVLPAGLSHLRVVITQPLFNMNYYECTVSTSIQDLEPIENLRLFPNPTAGLFTLIGTLPSAQQIEVAIFNAIGQQMTQQSQLSSAGLHMQLDLSHYPRGSYWGTVRLADGRLHTRKIVKQ